MILTDEISAIQAEVDKLKSQGIDKIIALGHSGYAMDLEIARRIKDVDIVVGGHTNTFLYNGQLEKLVVTRYSFKFSMQVAGPIGLHFRTSEIKCLLYYCLKKRFYVEPLVSQKVRITFRLDVVLF